eukprot:TRINITY_DN73631_c0_g1_i1.p1 TRINITY_DN73631_c0_g1~~TRINITY_DN73631_c0_g1_i1.p1  ORF type:complete len:2015 (+),score=482.72 TRINITY_DN73631_c0_g1_i1:72-6116(+)
MKRQALAEAVQEEEAFPRGRQFGGEDGLGSAAATAFRGDAAEEEDAGQGARPKGDKTRRKKARTGPSPQEEKGDEAGLLEEKKLDHAPRLSMMDLVDGALLMVAVREVNDDEITVNMPFNMIGYVARAQATEARFVDVEDRPELPTLYQPGQLLVAVVLGATEWKRSNRPRVNLSLRPSLANAGLTVDTTMQHMSLPAVVESEEEHVFRLDFGVEGVQGVLKKKEVSELTVAPRVGSILQVTAKAVNSGTVRCSLAADGSLAGAEVPVDAMKAGFLVKCLINKVFPAKTEDVPNAGLAVTFCNVFRGTIHLHHQTSGLTKAPVFERKQVITARLIAVIPGREVVAHLSLLPHLLDWNSDAKALNRVSIGSRLEAEALDSVPRFGVRFKCSLSSAKTSSSKVAFFCPSSRLADPDNFESKTDKKKDAGEDGPLVPEAGSKVTCRILGHNFLEGWVVVTRRPYDLREDTMVSVTEMEPGQLVVGTISRVAEFGVFVKLSEYITGLVHLRNLTDVPLATVSKKHKVGTKVKCRVLRVDPEKRQISLTCKKALVRDDFQLVSYSQARDNMLVNGFVTVVKEFGAIVAFYGNVVGLLPKEEMELDVAPSLGMAVTCRIKRVNHKRNRMSLSLDLTTGKEPSEFEGIDAPGDTLKSEPGHVVVNVKAVRCLEDGVLVRFQQSGGEEDIEKSGEAKAASESEFDGFVPTGHLSDSLDQAKALQEVIAAKLEAGETDAAILDLGAGVVLSGRFRPRKDAAETTEADGAEKELLPLASLLSLKPTLRLAAEEGAFVADVEQLEEARLYTGYVRHVFDFGAIVSFGAWKASGIATKHQIANHFVERPSEELTAGQTVRGVVGKIDLENKRFNVDLRASIATGSDAPLLRREAEALRLYFKTQAALAPPEASADPWRSLLPGTVLDVTVTAVQPYGILLAVTAHPGLTAVALKENMLSGQIDSVKDGEELRCAVLDVDVEKRILDVSLQPELVEAAATAVNGQCLLGATASESSGKKRKRKELAASADADAPKELRTMVALQKPAYSVLWSREPPLVVFAAPWDTRRWVSPLASVIHNIPRPAKSADIFNRLIATCPVGGEGEQKSRNERVRVPKILRPSEELSVGSPITMKIQSVKGLQVVCIAPVGIRGHVHATQLVDLNPEDGNAGSNPLESIFTSGKKTLEARVLRMQQHGDGPRGKLWHLELTCRPSLMQARETRDYEAANIKWSALKPGKKFPVAIAEVKKHSLWVEVSSNIRGQVEMLDATDDIAALKTPASFFQVGQVFDAEVLSASSSQKRLDMSFKGSMKGMIPEGKCLAKLIKLEKVAGRGTAASFCLPGRRYGYVHITEIFDFWAQAPLRRLRPGTFHEVYVIQSDVNGGTDPETARAQLSLRPSFVHGRATVAEERRPLTAADLKVKEKVSGYVVSANPKGVFVALSRSLVGRIQMKELSDQVINTEKVSLLYPVGELLQDIVVLEANVETGKVELSIRKNRENQLTAEQLSVGDVVSGYVRAIETYGFFVRIDNSCFDALVHKSEISDNASVTLASFPKGTQIFKAKVIKIEKGKVWCSVKPSVLEGAEKVEHEEDDDDEDEDLALHAGGGGEDSDEDSGTSGEDTSAAEATATTKAAKKKTSKAIARAKADSDDDLPWERVVSDTAGDVSRSSGMGGSVDTASADAAFRFSEFRVDDDGGASEECDDAVEDGEGGDEADDGQGRASKRQKKAKKAAEAKELRQREAENADGSRANDPRSVDDFERLLLTQGTTSIVWIRYMAFHLQMSDMERARQVAERAVKHVGFADAKERFNVWVAFMNLECTFGSDSTVEAIYKRAVSHNDGKQVHMQLARIHERNKKADLAVKVYEVCCKKFPQSKKVWLAFLTFLYGQGELEGARKTLPRCLAAVPRRKHPVVVTKAALLEYKHGSGERGRSLFEGLLDSYPSRTDLWSVYIDAHIKANTPPKAAKPRLAEVRSLMERCCVMKLKDTKMRFFFKRYLDFEKQWGDLESQELVRGKARSFVENLGS